MSRLSTAYRAWLFRLGSFALAGILLYLALRGVALAQIWNELKTAQYGLLLPLVGLMVLTLVLRAWRWRLLLNALSDSKHPSSIRLGEAFAALMIGYMVNYAAPRLGELARAAVLRQRSGMRLSSTLGTVAGERLLDIATLLVALFSVGILLLERWGIVYRLFIAPVFSQWHLAVLLAIGLGLCFLILRYLWQQHREKRWVGRIKIFLEAFTQGLLTLNRTGRPAALLLSTLAMWICYIPMAYLPLVMLHLAGPYQLTLWDAWVLVVLGAVGVALPVPGGLGSYHYITVQTLVHVFGVPQGPAVTYAVLAHGAQMVIYTVIGFGCLLLQGTGWRAMVELEAFSKSTQSPSNTH